MVPRLVFPSNKRSEYSKRFASLLHATGNTAVADVICPPVNTLFQPAIDHPAPRRLEAVDHAEGFEKTVNIWNILFVIR